MAVDRVHHGGCVYEVSLALKHWCLRNGAKHKDLALLVLTFMPTMIHLLLLLAKTVAAKIEK